MKNLIQLIVLIAVASGILIWFFRLKSTEHALAAEVRELELRHEALIEFQAETEKLNHTIRQQLQAEGEKLDRIEKACLYGNSIADFPVRRGDFVVIRNNSNDSGFEHAFFVPKGEHVLRLSLGLTEVCPNAGGGLSFLYSEDLSEVLEFPLVANAVGRLEFRIVTENDDAIAIINLLGGDGISIEKRKIDLGKRTLNGVFERSSGGQEIYLPGQIAGNLYQTHCYNTTIFNMAETKKGTRCLETTVSIRSPKSQIFLRDKDVGSWLSKPTNQEPAFSERFHRDGKSGLLVPSEAEKSNFSQ